MQATNGTMKENWRLLVASAMKPCTGGSTAPPGIAITSNAQTVSENITSVRAARDMLNWNSSRHRPTNGR